jgi:hypothetical protein
MIEFSSGEGKEAVAIFLYFSCQGFLLDFFLFSYVYILFDLFLFLNYCRYKNPD